MNCAGASRNLSAFFAAAPARDESPAASRSEAVAVPEGTLETAPPEAVVEEAREVAEPEAATPDVPAALERPDLVLSGTLVFVDAEGVEHTDRDGELNLVLWVGQSGTHHRVRVEHGRFEVRFEPVDKQQFLSLGGEL